MSDCIANYHFFQRHNVYFVYDFVHNLLFVPKQKEDYLKLQRDLLDFATNKKLYNKTHKYYYFFKNYVDKKKIFKTGKYLNEKNLCSTKITLMLAQVCNLRCSYCYGNDGKFGTDGQLMSKEIAIQSINYIVSNASTEAKYFLVTFFGGEPLLNFPTMKYVVEYIKKEFPEKHFTYTITTNGTLFTQEIIDFFKTNNISVLISLDGMQYIHDQNRKFADGSGSFSNVMESIELFKKSDMLFSTRATLSSDIFPRYEEIIQFFSDLGSDQIYISRLNNYHPDNSDFDIDVEDMLFESNFTGKYYEKIKTQVLNGLVPKYIPFIKVLERIHEATDSLISCGFMKGTTAVACNGDLYPCHRFVGIKGFCFGNIYNGLNKKTINRICKNIDRATLNCNFCWAKYICKRGCLRDIAKDNGSFISYPERYCDLQRDNIERALETHYEIIKQRPEFIKEFSEKEIEVYNII